MDSSLSLSQEPTKAPLYQQVKDAVVERILDGQWPEGSKVPSENEMTQSLGVSRMTINRALRELTAEGWLDRVQGAGSFVAGPRPQSAVLSIQSIAAEIQARGHRHSSELHLLRQEPARRLEAAKLGIAPGHPLFHSVILHRENGVPVQLEDRFVNPASAPDYLEQDFNSLTPYDYLIATAPLRDAEHTIRAVIPRARECKLLQIEAATPCLVLERRTWSGEHAVTWAIFTHPGNRYQLGGHFKGQGSS
ncbi:MAG: histidine utilization repressor [Pseudomonadota bacterium]